MGVCSHSDIYQMECPSYNILKGIFLLSEVIASLYCAQCPIKKIYVHNRAFKEDHGAKLHLEGMKSSSKFAGHSFHKNSILVSSWSLMF